MDTRISIPKLPDPKAIRREIVALKNRIGELRAMLRLAEVQHVGRTISKATRNQRR